MASAKLVQNFERVGIYDATTMLTTPDTLEIVDKQNRMFYEWTRIMIELTGANNRYSAKKHKDWWLLWVV